MQFECSPTTVCSSMRRAKCQSDCTRGVRIYQTKTIEMPPKVKECTMALMNSGEGLHSKTIAVWGLSSLSDTEWQPSCSSESSSDLGAISLRLTEISFTLTRDRTEPHPRKKQDSPSYHLVESELLSCSDRSLIPFLLLPCGLWRILLFCKWTNTTTFWGCWGLSSLCSDVPDWFLK
jgi:hypothetical protein